MSGYNFVDIEVTHKSADNLLDSLSEDGTEGNHLQSIHAIRFQAGQPNSELRSLKELDEIPSSYSNIRWMQPTVLSLRWTGKSFSQTRSG